MMFHVMLVILLLQLSIIGCDRIEMTDDSYLSYAELSKAGEPGNWIPSFIPQSATDIKGKHKVDTGGQMLTFYYEDKESILLSDRCKSTTVSEVELPESGFLNVSWWPAELVRGASNGTLNQYTFFSCERQAFLAIKRTTGRHQAFYWRVSLT